MKLFAAAVAAVGILALAGCGQEAKHDDHDHAGHSHDGHDHGPAKTTPKLPPSPELAKVVLPSGAPEQFIGVASAKKDATDGQEVAVSGRVKDFVEGQAVFTVMDSKIPSCADNPGDKCPTPWDYCCETRDTHIANMATVKIVGEDGEPLKGNLQGVNDIDHLTTVVAHGKAQRDQAGNLTVLADKIYLSR